MPRCAVGCGKSGKHGLGRQHETPVPAKLRRPVEARPVTCPLVHGRHRGHRRRHRRSSRLCLHVLLLPPKKTTNSGYAAPGRASGHGSGDVRCGALHLRRIVPSRSGRDDVSHRSVPAGQLLRATGRGACAEGTAPRNSSHYESIAAAIDNADAIADRATRTTAALQLQGQLPALNIRKIWSGKNCSSKPCTSRQVRYALYKNKTDCLMISSNLFDWSKNCL